MVNKCQSKSIHISFLLYIHLLLFYSIFYLSSVFYLLWSRVLCSYQSSLLFSSRFFLSLLLPVEFLSTLILSLNVLTYIELSGFILSNNLQFPRCHHLSITSSLSNQRYVWAYLAIWNFSI